MEIQSESIFRVKILNLGGYGGGFQIFKTQIVSQKNQGLLSFTRFVTLGSSVL